MELLQPTIRERGTNPRSPPLKSGNYDVLCVTFIKMPKPSEIGPQEEEGDEEREEAS